MTQTANAATEITREHDEIDRLALRIATLGQGSERTGLVHEVCARFLIHTQAEERYLYPAVRRLLPDGRFLAQFQTRRNRAVARTIETVERGEAEGDELDILVGHLLVGVQDHVDQQDAVLLPELLGVCCAEELESLGTQLHDGIRAAREAAQRAGGRVLGQADQATETDGNPTRAGARPEPRCRGFRALLQCIARSPRQADAD